MKLRNKNRTNIKVFGEIVPCNEYGCIAVKTDQGVTWYYRSLAELNEEWEDYEACPYTCHYRLSGPAEVLDKVRTTIDKLTEKYGMPDNEFGRYVPTPILLQALLGIKSEAPNYWGNLLFMEDQPDGTLSITMEVELTHVWPHVLEQGFPGIEVETEKEL